MTIPKRHHFVPESYLKRFVDSESGFLNVYSKRNNMWRRQLPKEVMIRNKYYHQNWAPEGIDKNVLEKYLGSELEPRGLSALQKLIETPETIHEQEMADIIVYLQFQRLRVPRQADMAKEIAKQAILHEMLKTPEGLEASKYTEIVIKDSFRFEFLHMMNNELSPYFSRMIWEVVGVESGLSFITNDSPVCFYNANFPPPAEPGAAHYGTIVLFPISKYFLLILRHPEYVKGEKTASIVDPEFKTVV